MQDYLSEKTIFGFPVSPGSAEALVRCGEKIKCILIAYFLGNIFAKNCCSRTVYLKIIASQRWDVFLRHSVYPVDDALYLFGEWCSGSMDDCGVCDAKIEFHCGQLCLSRQPIRLYT